MLSLSLDFLKNTHEVVDTRPESLSKCLNKLSLCIVRESLEKYHKHKCTRLKQLINSGHARFRELCLLEKIVESKKYGYLIATEYMIDDGSYYGQTGDALFYDGTTIWVVECKLIKTTMHDKFKISRREKVHDQAISCARRIKSWLEHLGKLDDWLFPISACDVIGVTLTDEGEEFYTTKKNSNQHFDVEFFQEYVNYFLS